MKKFDVEKGPGSKSAHRSSSHASHAPAVRAEDRLPIKLLKTLDTVFCRCYHHTLVRSPQQLPRDGPAILVCNHTSGLDPFLIQSVCSRVIVWMMAREYYDIKALTWAFKTIEAIPVDRGGRDVAATRAAMRALHNGRVLGIFPEGRITKTRELLPFQTGVAMMAIKTGVPVYPAYLEGTQRRMSMVRAFMEPQQARLAFGPPVQFDRSATSKEALDAATDKIKMDVAFLRSMATIPSQFRPNGDDSRVAR